MKTLGERVLLTFYPHQLNLKKVQYNMGLNKRYINQENLKRLIQNKGEITQIIEYIKNPDILIIEDDFSKKVCDAVLNNEIGNLIEIINGEKKR